MAAASSVTYYVRCWATGGRYHTEQWRQFDAGAGIASRTVLEAYSINSVISKKIITRESVFYSGENKSYFLHFDHEVYYHVVPRGPRALEGKPRPYKLLTQQFKVQCILLVTHIAAFVRF